MDTTDRGPEVRAVNIILIVLSLLIVPLRFLSRSLSPAGIGWDDWLCLPVLMTVLGENIAVIFDTLHGLGRHANDAPSDAVQYYYRTLVVEEAFYTVSITLIKTSVVLFYKRLFRTSTKLFTVSIWSILGVVLAWGIAFLFSGIFQCVPIEATWNPAITGTCVDQKAWFLGQAIPNIITDFLILLVPLPFLLQLKIGKAQKVGLLIVFLLGYFVPIISVIRLVYLVRAVNFVALRQSDPTINLDLSWNFVDITILSVLEPSLGLISCCLPALQYLFTQVIRRKISTTRNQHGSKRSFSLSPLKYGKVSHRQDSFTRLDEASRPAIDAGSSDSAHLTQTRISGNPFYSSDEGIGASKIHVRDEVDLSYEDRGEAC